jgi:helicase MOV-10
MERVMKQARYQRNPEYDERYVTQLLDNFRSHKAILYFSNAQFYDSRLRAKAPKAQVDVACDWKRLPKKGFPIILHSVLGPSEREPDGFSWFNLHEIKQVASYVHQLLKSGINGRPVTSQDIGIVSPYKSQITKIEKKLGMFEGLEIGTTEYFQGREKNIMIISTVKSKTSVGFLKNEKVCSNYHSISVYILINIQNCRA